MAFVKLDCGMLDSTLWIDRAARELFITALLMAEPFELVKSVPQINVRDLDETGFVVPPGWYGFVPAAGSGIVRRAGMEAEPGLMALERLGQPESESRTPDFDGRRMVRVNGGYIILNYDKYRSKDHTAAERARRYRERKSSRVTSDTSRVTGRNITQAEGEAEGEEYAEKIYCAYPRKVGKPKALLAITKALKTIKPSDLLKKTEAFAAMQNGADPQFIPHPATWFNQERFNDDPSTWKRSDSKPSLRRENIQVPITRR